MAHRHDGIRRRGLLGGGLGSLALLGFAGRAEVAEPKRATEACVGMGNQSRSVPIRAGISMVYAHDYFGAPWVTPEPILLIHGNGESSKAWTQWVGPLAAELRVIRPDMPGFGRSPTPQKYSWSPKELAADFGALMTRLGYRRFHLVGAKYGGTVALQLAADEPDRIVSLGVYGTPIKGTGNGGKADLTSFPALIKKVGVKKWAEQSQPARLGKEASQAQLDWWSAMLMAPADPKALIGATSAVAVMDITDSLPRITAPTLVVTTADSALQPVSTVKAYQEKIPNSKLLVMPGDSYHIAAVHPAECAAAELAFIHGLKEFPSAQRP